MAKVTVYSTPWCTYCKMAKEYFRDNKIEFTEFDVSKDENARNDMLNKSKQSGVPVIEIDGTLVVGFDKDRLQELLGI